MLYFPFEYTAQFVQTYVQMLVRTLISLFSFIFISTSIHLIQGYYSNLGGGLKSAPGAAYSCSCVTNNTLV